MKKYFSLICMIALTLWFAACNNATTDSVDKADSANDAKTDSTNDKVTANTTDEETSDFMVKAANGGMMEVELGKSAQDKATNSRVKEFGAMMVRDHSNANDELKALASRKNVTLPDSVGSDLRSHMNDLMKKKGNDFDKAYMNMMVDDHQDDVDMFQKASNNLKDPDVKAWAAKTLPTLQKHLDSAKEIANKKQ